MMESTKALEALSVVTRTGHDYMFYCFSRVRARGAFVRGGFMPFEQGLIESCTVKAQTRYDGCVGGGQGC